MAGLVLLCAGLLSVSLGILEIDAVQRTSGGGLRITWSSETGAQYRVQRTLDLRTGVWTDVDTNGVTAVGSQTIFEDLSPAGGDRSFWRVVKVGNADDKAPDIGPVSADLVQQGTQTLIRLSVTATDSNAVAGVSFLNGTNSIGQAVLGTNGLWQLLLVYDSKATNRLDLRARAQDAAGNAAFSAFFGLRPSQPYAEGMRPFTGASSLLAEDVDGTVQPFTYIPANHAGGSVSRALRFDFDLGARLLSTGASQRIEFNRAIVRFGPLAPLQFRPPGGGNGPQPHEYLIDLPSNDVTTLDVGNLDVADLKRLLGIPSSNGVPLLLFGAFSIDWVQGVLTDAGIVGGRFRVQNLGFPLPDLTGDYAEGIFDLFSGKDADFPIVGEWEIPGAGAKLKSAKAKPLTLTLRPDGTFALRGPVEILFDNGVRLTATLRLDDPIYSLTLEASKITIPLVTLLGTILPDDPEACIGAGFDDAQLDAMRECVRAHDKAYKAFVQAALALRPDTPTDQAIANPPGAQDLVAASLEAAASSIGIFAASNSGFPIQAVRDFINGWWAPTAAEPDDLLAAFENVIASERYVKALEQLRAADPADTNAVTAQNEMLAVLQEAKDALVTIAQSDAASSSLARLHEITSRLADYEVLALSNEVAQAFEHVLTAYVAKSAARYGIQSNVFDFAANPLIADLRYEECLDLVTSLMDAFAAANKSGIGADSIPLYPELRSQLLRRAGSRITARLDDALPNGDVFAATLALGDLAGFVGELGILGVSGQPGLPSETTVDQYTAELELVLTTSLLGDGPPLNELFRSAAALDAAVRAFESANPTSNFSADTRRRIHALLTERLPVAAIEAAAGTTDADLVLRAGIAHAKLGRSTSGTSTNYPWETAGLDLVADAWAASIATNRAWGQFPLLMRILLDEADALEREAAAITNNPALAQERAISRKRYLRVASEALAAARPAILSFWAETQTLRASQNSTNLADGALPGDLQLDRLRGSITYNRTNDFLGGAFKGRLIFPAEDLFLEILNATIDNTGAFSINAATQVPLEPFGNENIRLNATLLASGASNGLQSVSGTGDMFVAVPNTSGAGFTTQRFGVAYSYAPGEPGKPLKLQGTNAVEQAPLDFSPDFVIFNLAWRAEWRQGLFGGFRLTSQGLAGLYARKPRSIPANRDTDFWSVVEINDMTLLFDAQKARAEFTGGQLELPGDLFVKTDEFGSPLTNQRTRVAMSGTLRVDVPYTNPVPRFSSGAGSNQPFIVQFENFRFAVPEMPRSRITVVTAALHFVTNEFPFFQQLNAELRFPMPGMNAADTNQHRLLALDIDGEDWRVDGYPKLASLKLAQPLEIVELDGLKLLLLGGTNQLCTTQFKIERVPPTGAVARARLTLDGGMKAVFNSNLLANADQPGLALESVATCGSFVWDFVDFPAFSIPAIEIVGRVNLGGTNGLRIVGPDGTGGATLTFLGLVNVFNLSPTNEFEVGFTGAFDVSDFITLALLDAGLTWDGSSPAPRVSLGGARTDLGSESIELADGLLPIYPTSLGAQFRNPNLPIFPASGQSGLLDPTNIQFLVSAAANIPNALAIEAGAPGISGAIDDLAISLRRQGNLFVPDLALEGLGLEISGLDLPPLSGLGGGLYVGNLHDPTNLFFAGNLKGTAYEVGAEVSMAVHRQIGLLGVAFDLDVGPAGIPLDGGALGGVLLTGGGGGLSFGNRFAQPRDFLNSFQLEEVNGEKRPVNNGATSTFDATGTPAPVDYGSVPPGHGDPGCIRGAFPPPTINPLAEPHPTISNRVIFKGTALNASQLASLGVTPANTPISINAAVEFAVSKITLPTYAVVSNLIAAIPPVVPSNTVAFYTGILDRQLSQLENTTRNVIAGALGQAVSVNPNANLYDAIVQAAAAGIPALDLTYRTQGNFSHAAVSTVLKGKGGITVSTTGTAALDGEVTLIGLPIGTGILAFSLTDSLGSINPSLGGVVEAGLGPLELGAMSLAFQCDGCVDNVLAAFATFFGNAAAIADADTRAFLISVMNQVVPRTPARPTNGDPLAFYLQLTSNQQYAYIAGLFNVMDLASAGTPPPGLSPTAIASFGGSFGQFIADVLIAVNPRFCFEAKVKPTLFGFPLVPGPTPLDAAFAYERISAGGEFQQLAVNAEFSPAFLLSTLSMGPAGALIPSSDKVNFGYSLRVPAFTPQSAAFALTNPAQYAANQFTAFVQDSVMTFGYSVMPLGVPLADGQMRILMPRLQNHPTNPSRVINPLYPAGPANAWIPPSGAGLASSDDVILAALVRGKLSDATWRGVAGDLDDLFVFGAPPAPGSPEARIAAIGATLDLNKMNQLDFAADYFPYGGFIGASQLEFPSVFVQAPPFELFGRVLAPDFGNLGAWVADAQDLFNNYLAASSDIGQMAMYLPAPNPPFGFNFSTNTARDLIDAVSTADVLAILNRAAPQGLYPFEALMLAGYAKAQFLGLPLGEATVRYDGMAGRFTANAQIPTNSWLTYFVTSSVNVSIAKPAFMNATPPASTNLSSLYSNTPVGTVAERLTNLAVVVAGFSTGAPPVQAIADGIRQSLADTLPKVSMEAAAAVQIPNELRGLMRGGAAATVFAFSPAFDPAFEPANNAPYALAKRRGGVGVRGAFDFGYFPTNVPVNQHFAINISDASFFLGLDGAVGVFPAFAGQVQVGQFQLPGSVRFTNGLLAVSTAPDNLAPYFTVQGNVEPFTFTLPGSIDLLRARNLNGQNVLGGALTVFRNDGATANLGVGLELQPASLAIPFLGPQVAVTMHGGIGTNGQFQPFSFSTTPGQAWNAQLALSSPTNPATAPTFGIIDPFSPAGTNVLMSFRPSAPLTGSISGSGTDSFRAQFTVPTGFEVVFYPGSPHESRVATAPGTNVLFAFDSAGRVYCNLGSLPNLQLPGLISASAKIEFGYNPDDPQADVRVYTAGGAALPSPVNFGSINLVASTAIVVQIHNEGTLPANVGLSVAQAGTASDYTVSADGAQIEPGGKRSVTVVFQPKATGTRTATLSITSNDPDSPTQNFTLSGVGISEPVYIQSRPNVPFGDTLVGATSESTLTIGNAGSSNLVLTGATVSGAGFSVTPTTGATLAPGASRTYTVSFSPTALGAASGTLTLAINAPVGNRLIPLTGSGSESRWTTVLDSELAGSSATLNKIRMLDASEGFVVGNSGTFLQTRDGGRSWWRRDITRQNLTGIAVDKGDITLPTVGIYHLDEPPGSLVLLDSSGNNRHGSMARGGATQRPLRSFTYGRFGSGLDFDGTDDFAEIGTFAMPFDFSIAMWVNFDSTADNQALITKNSTTGSSQFRFGKYSGGYQVRISPFNVTTPAIPPLNTWIHLLVTGTRAVGTVTTTTVRIYQDNSLIGTHVVTGEVTQSTSFPWMIGGRMTGADLTQVADFFNGSMDEVMIFDGVLTSTQRANLFAINRNRMAITANNGQVFESYNRGALWSQLPDLNAFGWRNRANTFQTISWSGADFGSSSAGGPLYLVGTRVSGQFFRHVMVEDLHPGEDGIAGTNDDEFDAVAFSNAPPGALPIMTDIASVGSSMRVVGNDGVIFSQSQGAGLDSAFVGSSTNPGPALAAIERHSTAGGFVAVGLTGRILRASGSTTSVVAGGTAETLNDVVFRSDITPSYHVVGQNGAYLTSANTGANWQVVQDGLSGNNFGVDAVRVPGGAATEYHTWAVGANHAIQYRTPAPVTGSFMNFFPGKLDFGFVLVGESQTRTLEIRNRGKQPLQISSMVFSGPAAGRFTLGQSNLGTIPLDGAMALDIRYRPTDASSLDAAELVVTCNDPLQPSFRIPLEGRAGSRDWIPATLRNGSQPVTGTVARVRFTSNTRGYALVTESNAASVLYRTDDGGATWTRSTFPASGGIVKLTGMDFARPSNGSFDVGLVCGHVEDAAGTFIKGLVLRTVVANTSNPAPTWTDVTPIPAGDTIQPLRVISVALTDSFLFAATNNLRAALSTGGNSSQANVWGSTNSGIGWFTPANRPSASFNGGPVSTRAVIVPAFVPVFAAGGVSIFSRTNVLAQWPAAPQEVVAPGTIRDMHFMQSAAIGADFDQGWVVGNNGTFLLWNPNQAGVGDWYPPKDAERFGTINLAGVHSRNLFDVWVVGESKIFDSRDQGVTWGLSYDAGSAANLTCVSSMDGENAWAGGSLDGKATVWRYIPPPAPNTRALQTIDYRDWGTLQPGLSSARTVTLTNQGTNDLPVHEVVIEADEPRTRFRITSASPVNLSPGASSNLTVTFDSFDEPSLAEQLKPAFFHRFEQEWDATLYLDDSTNGRNASVTNLPAANRPALALSSFRDRSLRFDGDDRLEINQTAGPDAMPTNYAISIWAAPDAVNNTRVLLAKDDASGGDLFQLAMVSTGYQLRIRGSTIVAGGAPPLEWQHLAATFVHSGSVTRVAFYRDGGLLFVTNLAAQLGSASGKPWTLGGEYSSASATTNHFLGAIDDVALFTRALTDGEIQRLASKSPLYGEHRARVVINSGSERAVREVALRALVAPAPRFVRFVTEPAGLPVTIDGVAHPSPLGFTVVPFASAAPGAREWVEGSVHRISVASNAVLAHTGGSVSYRFSEWSAAPGRDFTITASRTMTNEFIATFAPAAVTAPAIGDPPPRVTGPDPLISGLAGAPKGPFLRITDGNLTLPNLAGNNFQVSGELFVSLTKVNGHLNSSGISLPPTGTVKFAEIGSSKWKIDATAGGAFLLEAFPPALTVLGYDVLPDGLTRLSYQPTTPTNAAQWALLFQLRRDFKPYPDMLEFKKGLVDLRWLATNSPPAFTLDLNGGLRVLRLPNNTFAFDQTLRVRLDTVNFNVSVSNLLAAAGIAQPANLFQAEPFRIGWGDLRLRRVNGGPVFLELGSLPFVFNSNTVAAISGSLGTDGTLLASGAIGENGVVRVDPAGRFLLRKIGTGSASFDLELSPKRFALETPALRLESTATSANGTVLAGISMPGIRFDSNGEFDTGKLKLPSFTFDGIGISGLPDGERKNNYIRLRRESGGKVIFTTKAEQAFLTCRQNLVLRISVTGSSAPALSGTMSGNFCLLPEDISLEYNSASSCQFSGSAFGFTVVFGSSCAGVTW